MYQTFYLVFKQLEKKVHFTMKSIHLTGQLIGDESIDPIVHSKSKTIRIFRFIRHLI